MFMIDQSSLDQTAIQGKNARVFVSLELSPSKWLVTSLSPGSERLSKRSVRGGDGPGLLGMLADLRAKAERQVGGPVKVVCIQEAGLDGFSLHRLLEANGVESHVVDAASIAAPRRRRRAKSDGIDGETLIRVLLAWLRREPRVCSMVRPPSVEAEDRRRLIRERDALVDERNRETNRIRGVLASQGVSGYDPLRRHRRERLAELTTLDGRPLPAYLRDELGRALDRLELLVCQIHAVEAARDRELASAGARDPATLLLQLRSIGGQTAALLAFEGFCRTFANRRQVAAYSGLAATPWQSGRVLHEQGVSATGNPRLRAGMVQLAWLWLRHQPGSALSRWWRQRVGAERGPVRRIAIVALARKLLIALWRYVTQGTIPEGAVLAKR
jgi:transposase